MVRGCGICNSKNKLLFGVPKDIKRQKLWSEACGISLKTRMQICETHFKPSDIVNGIKNTSFKRLKPDAVPISLRTNSTFEIKIEPDLESLNDEDDDPLELESIVKVEENNSKDIHVIHEQFEDQNKVADEPTTDKRLNCGRIDIILGKGKFLLNCHYCDKDFEIDEYLNFVQHIKKEHVKYLADFKELSSKETESLKTVVNYNSDKINIKTEFEDEQRLFEMDGDEDNEPMNQDTTKIPQENEKNLNELDELETKKVDEKNLITFNTNPKKLVIAFLELIKSNAILWHRRQSILKRFDETLAKVLFDFNAKFKKNQLTSEEARLSINHMKDLYYRITDPNHKRPFKNSRHKIQFPEFFALCKGIDENSKKIIYSCDKCHAFFFMETDLQIHRFKLHRIGELPFKCSRCNYGFAKAKIRDEHEAKHDRIKSYICEICKNGFASEEKLRAHAVIHTNDSKPVCEICGQMFVTHNQYQRHKLYHGSPKEKCHICGKLFFSKWNLSEHVKSHLNERQYECDVCGQKYNHQNDVTKHKRAVHKIQPQKRRFMWVNKDEIEKEKNENRNENDNSYDYHQQNKRNVDADNAEENLSMLSVHVFEEDEQ